MRQLVLAFLLGLGLATIPGGAGAATPPACEPPASTTDLSGTLSGGPLQILNSPLLQATVQGTGSYTGHVVFQPLPAPPPAISDGCQENSRFTVTGFTGIVLATGIAGTFFFNATQPTDATLEVHFGTQPNRPVLTFHSDKPVESSFGTVQFVQIVGGQVVASH